MTTKEKILEASRKLFNQHGLSNVSVRDICLELNISAGNFSYHFPNKDTIVTELYNIMLQEMQTVLSAIEQGKVSINFYLDSHKELFIIQSKYRFVFLNLFEILKQYPEIKKIYIQSTTFEKEMAIKLIQLYISKGVLKKDISSDHIERMITVGQIITSSWLVDAEIRFPSNEKKRLAFYMKICCGILEPHLTASSLKEYNSYFKNMNS